MSRGMGEDLERRAWWYDQAFDTRLLEPRPRGDQKMTTIICGYCGYEGSPRRKRSLTGRHMGHPDADSPDEHEPVCPECGEARDIRETSN